MRLRYRTWIRSSRTNRGRYRSCRRQSHRAQQRHQQQPSDRDRLQPERSHRSPAPAGPLIPGSFQQAIGKHSVLHREIRLVKWTPRRPTKESVSQNKKGRASARPAGTFSTPEVSASVISVAPLAWVLWAWVLSTLPGPWEQTASLILQVPLALVRRTARCRLRLRPW